MPRGGRRAATWRRCAPWCRRPNMSDTHAIAGPTRRGWLIGGVGLAAAAAGAGLAWWRLREGAVDDEATRRMWSLSFETPEGAALPMASFQGKPLLVNFWATWCAPCIEEMPMLAAFHRQHAANGWQVVGLA